MPLAVYVHHSGAWVHLAGAWDVPCPGEVNVPCPGEVYVLCPGALCRPTPQRSPAVTLWLRESERRATLG